MKAVERVVVTGMGAVTPLGTDLPSTWQRLINGEDAARPVTLFDVSECRCQIAAEAKLPDLPGLSHKKLSRLSRASRLALPAACQALRQAGLLLQDSALSAQRSALRMLPMSISTTGGAMELGQKFARGCFKGGKSPGRLFHGARYQAQHQIRDLQEFFDFQGPATVIANACASGANSVGHASDLIRSGRYECVLTGGYEALAELIYVGFDCLQALTRDRCRPFDRNRSGLMLGEGAAFLVLESESHARKRGAGILCELAGYGHSTDPHHLTQPNPAGPALVAAMRMALTQAQLFSEQIGYVNAHGTGTPLNDASECAAMNALFGDHGSISTHGSTSLAPRLRSGRDLSLPKRLATLSASRTGHDPEQSRMDHSPGVRMSSTKAAIGHTLGAAGSIEAIFAIQALITGNLPPQINTREPEPLLRQRLAAAGERCPDLQAVMSANLGFGGSNAALIFTRYEGSLSQDKKRVAQSVAAIT